MLPQLQGAEAHQRQNHRDNPEADDDGRFLPAQFLKMMVNRRHAEHTLAGHFEGGDLNHHRECLDHEQPADNREHDFMLTDDGDGTLFGVESREIDLNYFIGSEAEFLARYPAPQTTEATLIAKFGDTLVEYRRVS